MAWLIGAAIDGHADVEERGGSKVGLVRRWNGRGLAALDRIFAGRDRVELARTTGLRRRVGRGGERAARLAAGQGLWDPAGDRRRLMAMVLGAVAGLVGLGLVAGRGGGQPLGAAVPGGGGGRPAGRRGPGGAGALVELVDGRRPGRGCGCGWSRSGASSPGPRPITPTRPPSAGSSRSTPPGRWRWGRSTAGRGRWRRPAWRPIRRPPATPTSPRRWRRPRRPPRSSRRRAGAAAVAAGSGAAPAGWRRVLVS